MPAKSGVERISDFFRAFTVVLFLGHEFPNSNVAKARVIYLHGAPLDPSCTGEGLCLDAIEEALSRGEIGRR